MAAREGLVTMDQPSTSADRTARESRGGFRVRGSRKGRGAKTRQTESFRLRKNEDTQATFQNELTSIRDSYCKFDNLDDLLKSLSVGATVSRPPVQVVVNTQSATELLAAETFEYLANNKVQVKDTDKSTLSKVTTLQVTAKVAVACRKGPHEDVTTSDTVVNTVLSHFGKGLKSTAVLIDQIGSFELDDQQFVPRLPKITTPEEVPDGYVKTQITMNKQCLYVHPVEGDDLTTPEGVLRVPDDRRRWLDDDIVNVSELTERYADLLQRVAKKMSHGIIPIDLASGKGSPSQLVGSTENPRYGAEVDAWCVRPVSQSILIQGAAWRLGLNSTDVWHAQEIASCFTSVDTAAFYKKIMRVNEKASGEVR